jgi:hypothetical protein
MISKRVWITALLAFLVVPAMSFAADGTITIGAGTTINASTYFVCDHLSIDDAANSKLDLTGIPSTTTTNWGIVTTDYIRTGTTPSTTTPPLGVGGASANGVIGAIRTAYGTGANAGLWTGNAGVITSDQVLAQANLIGSKNGLYAIGECSSNLYTASIPSGGLGKTTFHGITIPAGLTTPYALVQVTYNGDVNFDGKISNLDLTKLKARIATAPAEKSYFNGDINYDGVVSNLDLTKLKNVVNYQSSHTTFPTLSLTWVPAASAAAVPEPSMIVLGLFGIACFFGFRKFSK